MIYLIFHKVRGEPQFDIAELDDHCTYIVSSSGHAAYPMFVWPLHDVVPAWIMKISRQIVHLREWHELQDHYHASDVLARRGGKTPNHFTADDL